MSDGYIVSCGNAKIAIDRWNAQDAAAYFLTHMHADHYKGLHDEWCRGVIYCSEVTRLLLLRKWPTLRNRVKSLVVDDTVTIHLAQQELVSVTLIDAHHCPAELLQHPALSAGPLDLLVLDNTYCHPRYAFPTRFEGCQGVLQLTQAHAQMDIVVAVDSLGKEDLLAAVAHATGTCIGIAADRLETVVIAGLPEQLFTTEMGFTRIRALPKWMVTAQFLAKLNRRKATLGIIPTGFACLYPNTQPLTGRNERCIALTPAGPCSVPPHEHAPPAWQHQPHQQQHSQHQLQQQCSQQQCGQLYQVPQLGQQNLWQLQQEQQQWQQQQQQGQKQRGQQAHTAQQRVCQAQHAQHQLHQQACGHAKQQDQSQRQPQLQQQLSQPQQSDQQSLQQTQQHTQEHQQPSTHQQHCLHQPQAAVAGTCQLYSSQQRDKEHIVPCTGVADNGDAQLSCSQQTDGHPHLHQAGPSQDGGEPDCSQEVDGQLWGMPPQSSSQLFSSTEALQVDLEAYAALVHFTETTQPESTEETEAVAAPASAAEIEHARTLLKRVPYSLHNNFEELQSFVAHLRPHAIAPIVTKTYDSRYPIDPNLHFKHLLGDPKQAAELSSAKGTRAVQAVLSGCPKGLMGLGRRGTKRAAKSLGASAGHENTAQHGSWQGFLGRCAGSVKQRRYSAPSRQARCVSGMATAICTPQEPTASRSGGAVVKQEL